jgi:hypothetical protein
VPNRPVYVLQGLRIAQSNRLGMNDVPAVRSEIVVHDDKLDDGLEAFQRPYDVHAVCPGTAIVDIEDLN